MRLSLCQSAVLGSQGIVVERTAATFFRRDISIKAMSSGGKMAFRLSPPLNTRRCEEMKFFFRVVKTIFYDLSLDCSE